MTLSIPSNILEIYHKIEDSGSEVYFVGGCVRDLMMGRDTNDWDFATNAKPDEIQEMFENSFYDNPFGTVGIPISSEFENQIVEITTYRHEGVYRDKRRPENVMWGKTIEEDLARRDFTINAIAFRLKKRSPEKISDLDVVDPYKGLKDLENGVIRAVGEAEMRFSEDALRMIRAVRIASQLNFEIEPLTLRAIKKNSGDITHVAWERIRDEIFKMLSSENPAQGIRSLERVGMLDVILPELVAGRGISMVRPGRHHTTDVYEHNLLALEHCPSKDPLVRFATLLHDIGKSETVGTDDEGLVVFYNHEVVGAAMAARIGKRFRLSKKQNEKLFTLVRWHMFSAHENLSDKAIRRFIRRVGIDNISDMIDLRIGDRLGSGAEKAESWRLKEFQERVSRELNPPFSLNDLEIDGDEIMKILKIKPGPLVGKILKTLFEEVDDDLSLNNKEHLIKRTKILGELYNNKNVS